MRAGLLLYADTESKRMEGDAKKEAPWVDRTGNARQTLQGFSQEDGDAVTLGVAHNVDYGPYLELANNKKYGILRTTILKHAPGILKGLQALFRR